MIRHHSLKRFTAVLFLFIIVSCSSRKETEVQRCFYYWKSVFNPAPEELSVLDSLSIKKLYIKFFDVEWNAALRSAIPIAQVQFKQLPPHGIAIVPVVFITNETLQQLNEPGIDSLGQKMVTLIRDIVALHHLAIFPEVQMDCDWTAKTKEKYFRLLRTVREQAFLKNKMLSATIRLHQLKFIGQSGIPPVDKGLLMCYNMGNLRNPGVENSILDISELKKYIDRLSSYPLPLDVALPVFDWYVWFRHERFKGLIHGPDLGEGFPGTKKTVFHQDTTINGYTFETGDWLRYENSPASAIKKTAELITEKLSSKKINVVLYHLDAYNLKKYTVYEMEDFFNRFH
jgi:hypothetical protein